MKLFAVVLSILPISFAYSQVIPVLDLHSSAVIAEVDIPLESDTIARLRDANCHYAGLVKKSDNMYLLSIQKAVCGGTERTFSGKNVQLFKPVKAGTEIIIPIGPADYVSES